jgi:hypothetical protein
MNDITRCPSHELLVTYLYDECDPAERDAIAAHLALCASCPEEVQGLRDARVHLAAWSPPAMPLGFQLTRTESEPSKVLRPAAWWRRPLPAWAQAAAAAVIFAAGMSAGAARSGDPGIENAATRSDTPAAITAPVASNTVSRDDFDRLAARLRSVESTQSKFVSLPRTPAGNIDEQALLLNFTKLIDERVALSERKTIGGLNEIVLALNASNDRLTERMDLLELDQRQQGVAITRVAQTGLSQVPAFFQNGGR